MNIGLQAKPEVTGFGDLGLVVVLPQQIAGRYPATSENKTTLRADRSPLQIGGEDQWAFALPIRLAILAL